MMLLNQISLILALVSSAHALPVESSLSIDGHSFEYYSNMELAAQHPAVTRAIIVVHGSDLNADTYYNTMDGLSRELQVADSTVIISPHFKAPSQPRSILPGDLVYTDEGWLRGDSATNDAQVTSFDVMDLFLQKLIDRQAFPNLKSIVVTGHSAGGQLTQKFAFGSQIEGQAPQIHFRYIVVNPGSYLYLNNKRPMNGSFDVPNTTCAYNDYKFGLENLNAYQSRVPTTTLVSNYLKRDIVYFLGEADTLMDPNDVDQGCEAAIQGQFRFQRGQNFKASLDLQFPTHQHHILTVPGVGHTEYGMYRSDNGRRILFSDSL